MLSPEQKQKLIERYTLAISTNNQRIADYYQDIFELEHENKSLTERLRVLKTPVDPVPLKEYKDE